MLCACAGGCLQLMSLCCSALQLCKILIFATTKETFTQRLLYNFKQTPAPTRTPTGDHLTGPAPHACIISVVIWNIRHFLRPQMAQPQPPPTQCQPTLLPSGKKKNRLQRAIIFTVHTTAGDANKRESVRRPSDGQRQRSNAIWLLKYSQFNLHKHSDSVK